MKGMVLAGGSGSGLYPITQGVSKHLLSVYVKPMIYDLISVLMLAGIRDILIITTAQDINSYKRLLGNGENFRIALSYAVQDSPKRFGVVELGENMHVLSLEEKPASPKSNYLVICLYFYDDAVIDIAKQVTPSARGELENTSVNNVDRERGDLSVDILCRGFAWLDTGTHESLLEAGSFVQTLEHRQGLKIACLEEIVFDQNWVSLDELVRSAKELNKISYGKYLMALVGANQ